MNEEYHKVPPSLGLAAGGIKVLVTSHAPLHESQARRAGEQLRHLVPSDSVFDPGLLFELLQPDDRCYPERAGAHNLAVNPARAA